MSFKLIGLMTVRNEAWVLPASIPAAMQWVDQLVICDHNSTDATEGILESLEYKYNGKLIILEEHNPAWNEAFIRQRLLDKGRALGGTHFAVIDADEIMTANLTERICRRNIAIRNTGTSEPYEGLLRFPWIHCWRSLTQMRVDNSPFGTASVPVIFADSPELSYRPDSDGYQLHKRVPFRWNQYQLPMASRDQMVRAGQGILHLQHAKWPRVVAKQTLYEMDELVRYGSVRGSYAKTLNEDGLKLADIPEGWWLKIQAVVAYVSEDTDIPLKDLIEGDGKKVCDVANRAFVNLNATPWQRDEIDRLVDKYGWEKFQPSVLFQRMYPSREAYMMEKV